VWEVPWKCVESAGNNGKCVGSVREKSVEDVLEVVGGAELSATTQKNGTQRRFEDVRKESR